MIAFSDKAIQRHAGQAARRALSPAARQSASEKICASLLADPLLAQFHNLLVYRALAEEVDLSSFCRLAAARGQKIAYPYCSAPGIMDAYLPGDAPWQPDFCRIPAPCPNPAFRMPPEKLDAVLAPLTVFDAECRRVGMGGGFYDRYLPACIRAQKIGVAFMVQCAVRADTGPLDVLLDSVFTERQIFHRAE